MKICLENRLVVLPKLYLQRMFSLLTQKLESSPALSSVVWLNAQWKESPFWRFTICELSAFSGLKYLAYR